MISTTYSLALLRRDVTDITRPDSNVKPASEQSECGLAMNGGTIGTKKQVICAS